MFVSPPMEHDSVKQATTLPQVNTQKWEENMENPINSYISDWPGHYGMIKIGFLVINNTSDNIHSLGKLIIDNSCRDFSL